MGVPTGVAVTTTGVGVGTTMRVALTACCTTVASAKVVAVKSGVGARVIGTGVATAVATAAVGGGWAVRVALTPAIIAVWIAFAVAVPSSVAVGGTVTSGVAVNVGGAVSSLPPVLTVTVTIGSASVGPPKRSPKK